MNKRVLGAQYEAETAEYLSRRGYRILERNFRCRFGEIDLICEKAGCIVFVEVKYRGSSRCGSPSAAVDRRKQVRISNAASCYLYLRHIPADTPCRFDVAAISSGSVRIIENAFPYRGYFGG